MSCPVDATGAPPRLPENIAMLADQPATSLTTYADEWRPQLSSSCTQGHCRRISPLPGNIFPTEPPCSAYKRPASSPLGEQQSRARSRSDQRKACKSSTALLPPSCRSRANRSPPPPPSHLVAVSRTMTSKPPRSRSRPPLRSAAAAGAPPPPSRCCQSRAHRAPQPPTLNAAVSQNCARRRRGLPCLLRCHNASPRRSRLAPTSPCPRTTGALRPAAAPELLRPWTAAVRHDARPSTAMPALSPLLAGVATTTCPAVALRAQLERHATIAAPCSAAPCTLSR